MLKKLNFRIFSDLHLEFDKGNTIMNKCINLSKNNNVDYLILAGDIVNYKTKNKLYELIHNIRPYYKKIFYVLGNHEFYFNDIMSKHTINDSQNNSSNTKDNNITSKKDVMKYVIEDYRRICENIDITLLDNDFYRIDNTNIVLYGTTMWSKNSEKSLKYINDVHFLNKSEINIAHEISKKKLEHFLYDDINKNNNIIVITHHMPSFKFISKKYYEDDPENGTNAAFASNLEHLFTPNISNWIFGHTHDRSTFNINNINFYANPHGYYGEIKEEYTDTIVSVNY